MLSPRGTVVATIIVLVILIQVRPGYGITQPPPAIPAGFVEVTGPHGIVVLVGPLQGSSTTGYEREIIVPGRPPFMVSTEPRVTPQDIADIYG